MSNKTKIYSELKGFKRRYWIARLVQGLLIFSGTGLVLIGIIALIEYTSWLGSGQRMVLFYLCLTVELLLLAYYVFWPIMQFILNGKALSDWKAATLIGNLLDGVDDRLLNFLELDRTNKRNELIDASLEQKGKHLLEYRFSKSFDFSTLRPYLLFLVPLALLSIFIWQGNRWHMIEEGTTRLVNYNVEYKRVLPFTLTALNAFEVEEGADIKVEFELSGSFIPEELELISSQGAERLQVSGARVWHTFNNCYNDIEFRLAYDGILSEVFPITVIKKPVIGRVSVEVEPPSYTGIDSYAIQNTNKIEVPEGSQIRVSYAFKNTTTIDVAIRAKASDDLYQSIENEGSIEQKVKRNTELNASVNGLELHRLQVNILTDKRPELSVGIDSLESVFRININSNDDYKIVSAKAIIEDAGSRKESIPLKPDGNILKRQLSFSYDQLNMMKSIEVSVRDNQHIVTKRIDLNQFKEPELSTDQLLENAGSEIAKMLNEENESDQSTEKNQKQNKSNKELKQEAEQLSKTVKKLTKKDSVQFNRLDQISEEIQDLLEKMEKDIPEAQKRISQKKLEEKIAELEKEWMILKMLDQLNNMQDSLKKNPFVDEKRMEKMLLDAKNLEKKMGAKEKENVEWKKFEDLEKNNKDLKEKAEANSDEKNKGKDSKEEQGEQEKSKGQEEDEKKKGGDQPQNENELKQQMQQDSEQLKQQLSAMSSMMMMESMQANIELIRRLELRSLKASKKQEEVYTETATANEYDKKVILAQTEVKNSAGSILDSLSALAVSDPMLGNVLNKNKQLLHEHLNEMTNLNEMNAGQLSSKQRYLQYSLNDLASILYDILKSESEQMQSMMSGNKSCNKPKSGKGQKESLSKQQKKLGEKMGKMKKPGKGKNGRQTLSEADLLELIKGQEQILEQYQQQQNEKGGQKAGDGEVIEKMNKQLDDLVNNNIDKALERNKEIEDKLITIEKSDNQKKEDDKKRQSRENKLDYESIRNTALQEYLRKNQSGSGVVNLPALKKYYSGKWVIINQ